MLRISFNMTGRHPVLTLNDNATPGAIGKTTPDMTIFDGVVR